MKKTWKRSEGLLDRYFGFQRKIGRSKKKARGKETEKKTFEMECSFYVYEK